MEEEAELKKSLECKNKWLVISIEEEIKEIERK